MDLRFMAIVMAIAIIMDILGRRARRRAGEQQADQPADEGWNVLQALADADKLPEKLARDALPPGRPRPEARAELDPEPVTRVDVPGPEPSVPRFDPFAWPEPVELERTIPERAAREPVAPDPFAAEPVLPAPAGSAPTAVPSAVRSEPEPWEPPTRDRAARPIEVRSRAPRTVERESRTARPSPEIERTPYPLPDVATLSRRSRTSDVADRLGLTDGQALRRIVVAREVLGPPLALRGIGRGAGGHGS